MELSSRDQRVEKWTKNSNCPPIRVFTSGLFNDKLIISHIPLSIYNFVETGGKKIARIATRPLLFLATSPRTHAATGYQLINKISYFQNQFFFFYFNREILLYLRVFFFHPLHHSIIWLHRRREKKTQIRYNFEPEWMDNWGKKSSTGTHTHDTVKHIHTNCQTWLDCVLIFFSSLFQLGTWEVFFR